VFLVKDLLVSVLRPDEGIEPHNTICFIPQGEAPASKATLLALKGNVERVLAEIDREEKMIGEELRPQTLAEVEMLQTAFHEAQDELKRLRAELSET
jgi:hypothetical protein